MPVVTKTEGILNLVSEPGAIQIEAAAEGEMTAEGKPRLPRFSMVAYTGGPMRIAGWRYPVVVDLAGLAIPSQNRPIRFGHDAASGVGHTDSIQIQDGKLLAAGIVSRDTVEQDFALKRQLFLCEQGYGYQIRVVGTAKAQAAGEVPA